LIENKQLLSLRNQILANLKKQKKKLKKEKQQLESKEEEEVLVGPQFPMESSLSLPKAPLT